MRRIHLAGVLIVSALIVLIVIFYPVVRVIPVAITASEHGASVRLDVDDTTLLTPTDCVTVSWHVEHITAVELDRKAVVGEGARPSCDMSVDLRVTYQDGTAHTYSVAKQSPVTSLIARIMIVLALVAFILGVVVSGLPAAIVRRTRDAVLGRALASRSPWVTTDRQMSPVVLSVMIVILLVGAAVRVHFQARSLRWDETRTYLDFASLPISEIVQVYTAPNNHIFHSLLVHETTMLFGVYPWTLRLPVYLFGILVIAATFAFARRFYGLQVAILAAALAAGASWMIEFSANARGYNIVTVCFLLMLVLASDLKRRGSTRKWLAFALLGVVGLYTIPTMAYPLGVVCLWLGLSIMLENRGRKRQQRLRDMALALLLMGVLTGLLYLPAYLYLHSGTAYDVNFNNLSTVTWADFSEAISTELGKVWTAVQRDLASWVNILLLFGVFASVIFHRWLTRFRLSLLLIAALWLMSVVFVQMAITYDRLWTFLHPLYLTFACAGLLYFWWLIAPRRVWPGMGVIGVLAVVIALVSAGGDVRSNMVDLTLSERQLNVEGAVRYLRDHALAGTSTYCVFQCPVIRFYGLAYKVPFQFEGQYRKKVTDSPIFVVISRTGEQLSGDEINVKGALRFANVPYAQYQPWQIVYQEGDTVVVRLDPL